MATSVNDGGAVWSTAFAEALVEPGNVSNDATRLSPYAAAPAAGEAAGQLDRVSSSTGEILRHLDELAAAQRALAAIAQEVLDELRRLRDA